MTAIESALSASVRQTTPAWSASVRLPAIQALVRDVLAQLEALGQELSSLEPPKRPTGVDPRHAALAERAYRRRLQSFETRRDALIGKMAQLNANIEVAYRSLAEAQARVQKKIRARESQRGHKLARDNALREAARDLRAEVQRLDAAAERFQDSTTEAAVIPRHVDVHRDGDGRADGTTRAWQIMLGDGAAQRRLSTFRFDSLDVLPANEPLTQQAVRVLTDDDLDVQARGNGEDDRWDLVTTTLLNEQQPGGCAPASVWAQMARVMGVDEQTLVSRVLGIPESSRILKRYANEFREQMKALGHPVSAARADEVAWRMVAGQRIGKPRFFLRTDDSWRAGIPAPITKTIVQNFDRDPAVPSAHEDAFALVRDELIRGDEIDIEAWRAAAEQYGMSLDKFLRKAMPWSYQRRTETAERLGKDYARLVVANGGARPTQQEQLRIGMRLAVGMALGSPTAFLTGDVMSHGVTRKQVNRALKAAEGTSLQNTKGMGVGQRYDYYASLIGKNLDRAPGAVNILSLRKPTDNDVNGGLGRYDDTTVLIWVDKKGRKHVEEFVSNTDPSNTYLKRGYGLDTNRDGKKELGRIPAGFYRYATGYSSTLGNILRPKRDFAVEFDVNRDGRYNDAVKRTGYGRQYLFHGGPSDRTGSAGCQTMPPAEYTRFWNLIQRASNESSLGYTLIDTTQMNRNSNLPFANAPSLPKLKPIKRDAHADLFSISDRDLAELSALLAADGGRRGAMAS